jgi:uncharacterized protein YcnI
MTSPSAVHADVPGRRRHPRSRCHRRRPHRSGLVLRAAAIVLLAGLALTSANVASAHVRVDPDSTASGSFSALTFRVPNEAEKAGTVKVAVQLPQDTPLLYVSTKPIPGWTAKLTEAPLPEPVQSFGTTITKAVRTVTWTAENDTGIGPGEYQEFSISAGPLPAAGPILFPTEQVYSDGTVVAWDEPTPASGAEPEHPAPAFEITMAEPAQVPAAAPAAASSSGTDSIARGLAVGALVVAALSLVVALLSARRKTVQ